MGISASVMDYRVVARLEGRNHRALEPTEWGKGKSRSSLDVQKRPTLHNGETQPFAGTTLQSKDERPAVQAYLNINPQCRPDHIMVVRSE